MTIGFLRPIGANADVKELEYVSALHQTAMPKIRHDGSIKDEDIVLFLGSRYGIEVTAEEVRKTILHGMGGGNDDDDEEDVIDLMEMVAILLIPTLIKASNMCAEQRRRRLEREQADEENDLDGEFDDLDDLDDTGKEPPLKRDSFKTDFEYREYLKNHESAQSLLPPSGMLQYVLDMILHDVTDSRTPKPLTAALLRKIFKSYGEHEIANDTALLDEMVVAATRGSGVGSGTGEDDDDKNQETKLLDVETFARGLTGDVLLYDVENEQKWTTNYYDVFRSHKHAATVDQEVSQDRKPTMMRVGFRRNQEEIQRARMEGTVSIRKRWTAPSIDFPAGTFRNKWLVVFIWLSFVLTYRTFIYGAPEETSCGDEENEVDEFFCQMIAAVIVWLARFTSFCIYGLVYIGLGMLGNSIENNNPCPVMFAILVIFFLAVSGPLALLGREGTDADRRFLYVMCVLFGSLAILMQLLDLIRLLTPRSCLARFPRWDRFTTPGTIRKESAAKRSAAYKLNTMTKNALDVVTLNDQENVIDTHFGQALLAFSKIGKKYEEAGGFWWTWKRVFNEDLANREGISLHARILVGNIAMVIIAVSLLFSGGVLYRAANDDYNQEQVSGTVNRTITKFFRQDIDEALVEETLGNVGRLVSDLYVSSVNETTADCSSLASDLGSLTDAGCGFIDANNFSSFVLGENSSAVSNFSNFVSSVPFESVPFEGSSFQCLGGQSPSQLCGLLQYGEENVEALSQLGISLESFDLAVLESNGFDLDATRRVVEVTAQRFAEDSIQENYPSRRYMINVPVVFAVATAVATAMYLTVVYVPSATSTVLQFRCGEIPTFRDPNYFRYRVGADQSTILLGSIFWGCWFSSILVGGVVGAVVFVCLWQVTAPLVIQGLSILIGILVTLLIKILLVQCCRRRFNVAFYRRRVANANIVAIALEAANFALSSGFVFLRAVKLVIIALLYIGRIDTPFLAPGVGRYGGFELDNYPTIFRKDVLAHDAHRHPYLELLGVMYMMKLRYGERFGKSAGSCWRLMFVYALMPWLSKYRILARPELEEQLKDGDGSTVASSRSGGIDRGFVSLRHTRDELEDRELDELNVPSDKKDGESDKKDGDVIVTGEKKNGDGIEVVPATDKVKMLEQEVADLKNQIRSLKMEQAAARIRMNAAKSRTQGETS